MDLAMTLKTRMVQAQVFDFFRSFAMLCQFPAKKYSILDVFQLKQIDWWRFGTFERCFLLLDFEFWRQFDLI